MLTLIVDGAMLWRMAQREMARHKIRRRIDLMLPIEGIQEGEPDFLNC